MNLPNKITVFRVALVPVFLVLLLCDGIPQNYLFALIVFALASISDWLDGNIARKGNLITDFGKFLDPLADKLLVFSALIGLIPGGLVPAAAAFVIIARDTAVNGLRTIAASGGTVIAANKFGKIKTAVQMVAICLSLGALAAVEMFSLVSWLPTVTLVARIVWWIIAAYTAVTLIIYFKQNGKFLDPTK